MSLSQAQYTSKIESQSAIARKVLSAVPIAEPWSRTQIKNELFRVTQASIDSRTIDGCLRSLREGGLIKEMSHDRYMQILPHEKPERPMRIVDAELPMPGDPPMVPDGRATEHPLVIELIPQTLDDRLHGLMERLIEDAAELDAIRGEFRAELAAARQSTVKLGELRTLLQGL